MRRFLEGAQGRPRHHPALSFCPSLPAFLGTPPAHHQLHPDGTLPKSGATMLITTALKAGTGKIR